MTAFHPFSGVFAAVDYYNHNCPVRMKPVNLMERSHGSMDPDDQTELWTQTHMAIWRALKPIQRQRKGQAFRAWFLVPREDRGTLAKEDLARVLHCSVRTLNRDLWEVVDLVEAELVTDGLLESADDREEAARQVEQQNRWQVVRQPQ